MFSVVSEVEFVCPSDWRQGSHVNITHGAIGHLTIQGLPPPTPALSPGPTLHKFKLVQLGMSLTLYSYCRPIYRPVRSECSSCRVLTGIQRGIFSILIGTWKQELPQDLVMLIWSRTVQFLSCGFVLNLCPGWWRVTRREWDQGVKRE